MEQNKITSNKQVILIADSNPDNIDVLTAMLRPFYLVKSATSGAMALKIAASSEPPDLILLDSMMQEMDGYTVCEQLKANPSTRKIPVIFVSTTDETWDETKGLALGADDSITKPVRPSIVKALIKTHHRKPHYQDREVFSYTGSCGRTCGGGSGIAADGGSHA